MSRKFLDDNIRTFGSRSELPGSSNTSYNAGHEFQDRVDATIFKNEGTQRDGAIFGAQFANRYDLVELFKQTPGVNGDLASATEATRVPANRDFEIVGTNSTSALCTFAAGGGITLTTAGADEDQEIVTPHLDTAQTAWAGTNWNTNDRVVFETTIKTAAAITAQIIWAGLKLTNDNVVGTDDDQVFLRYEAGVNSGKFQLITSASGTDTSTDTDVTVAVSTSYHIKLVVNGDRDVHAYINGVLVARIQTALTANIDLIPYVGIEASAAAAKAVTCRGIRCSKDYND